MHTIYTSTNSQSTGCPFSFPYHLFNYLIPFSPIHLISVVASDAPYCPTSLPYSHRQSIHLHVVISYELILPVMFHARPHPTGHSCITVCCQNLNPTPTAEIMPLLHLIPAGCVFLPCFCYPCNIEWELPSHSMAPVNAVSRPYILSLSKMFHETQKNPQTLMFTGFLSLPK